MKTKDKKREEAAVRQAISSALTPEQRLSKLDAAFGKGQGAAKERAKLAKLLGQEASPSVVGDAGAPKKERKGKKAKAA